MHEQLTWHWLDVLEANITQHPVFMCFVVVPVAMLALLALMVMAVSKWTP